MWSSSARGTSQTLTPTCNISSWNLVWRFCRVPGAWLPHSNSTIGVYRTGRGGAPGSAMFLQGDPSARKSPCFTGHSAVLRNPQHLLAGPDAVFTGLHIWWQFVSQPPAFPSSSSARQATGAPVPHIALLCEACVTSSGFLITHSGLSTRVSRARAVSGHEDGRSTGTDWGPLD